MRERRTNLSRADKHHHEYHRLRYSQVKLQLIHSSSSSSSGSGRYSVAFINFKACFCFFKFKAATNQSFYVHITGTLTHSLTIPTPSPLNLPPSLHSQVQFVGSSNPLLVNSNAYFMNLNPCYGNGSQPIATLLERGVFSKGYLSEIRNSECAKVFLCILTTSVVIIIYS